ncbi:hypothetical protein SteCoe_87 [Stentor coeruleus]|uniref:Polycystin cation channel PKD1/PKD2 domain-containing protein n=1 Tax=Stentor coeruleus TaxID=5963 RepID=A0A1R2D507_9CILI|nr:hypothetical protein SteCoe_87 [Stentor coeruleus]
MEDEILKPGQLTNKGDDADKDQNDAEKEPLDQEGSSDDEENLKLDDTDWERIELRIRNNQKFIEKALQEIPVNVKGVYLSVIVSFLFIVLASLINRVEDVSNMSIMLKYPYENNVWDLSSGSTLWEVTALTDLNDYVRNVAIPSSYSDLGNYNSFIGMRFTLKLSKLIEQPIKDYKGAKEYIEMNPDMLVGTNSVGQDSARKGIWSYEVGFDGADGYVLYIFPHASSLNEALLKWREATAMWMDEWSFSSLAIEYLFHNNNYACSLYYYQTFSQTGAGIIDVKSASVGSFIEKFDTFKNESLTILVIFIVYSLGFSLQIFKLAQNLMRTCKTLLVKKKLDLVWHEYIEIMSVVLALASLIMFGLYVILDSGKYTLPITRNEDLNGIINYCRSFRMLVQITALAALLISFKVIVVLRYKFPSFGVLFDTILGAKTDIINFMLITIFLLVGFVFMAYLAFGYRLFEFSNIAKTFGKLFDMVLGQEDIKDSMSIVNESFSAIFILVYLTIFFLVLTNMFLAIVMSTYDDLKQKGQLILEAKAEMIAEQSEEWFQTLFNLLLFRVKSVENDAIEYENLQDSIKEELTDEKKEKLNEDIKMHETLILASTKVDLIKIFKTNFGKLTSLNKPNLLTHEQNMAKIYSTLRKILEREELKKKYNAILQRKVDHNFRLVVQMMIYLIFIIIFIVMILMRLKITDSYGMQTATHQSFTTPTYGNDLTIDNIHTQDDVFNYLYEVFIPQISQDELFNHNYFLGETRARITLQLYNLEQNTKQFSAKLQPYYVDKTAPKLKKTDIRGESTELLYLYVQPGTKETFGQFGGYVSYLSTKNNMESNVLNFQRDNILGKSGYYMAIEWATYNANLNLFTYSYLQFIHEVSGDITHTLYINPIDLDFFNDSIPIRGILEICYFLFTMYYFVIETKEWYEVWVSVRKEEKLKQRGSEALARVLGKLLGEREAERGCGAIMSSAFKSVKKGLVWVINFCFNLIQTTKRYFSKDVFNVIDVISITLSIMNLSQIFQLSMNQFMRDYKVEDSDNYDLCGELAVIDGIMVSYRQIVSFNCLIIFVRLLQFYKFSKKLSLLTDILNSAKLDLIFFMLMFSIILFAYTLMSYLLLGHILTGFNSLQKALISCYLMLVGEFHSQDIYDADYIFGTLFFVSLIIVFSLILLNMFIAIIGSHFERVSEEAGNSEEEMGFFAKIWSVLMARKNKKKYLDEPEKLNSQGEENDDGLDGDKVTGENDDDIFRIEAVGPDPSNPTFWLKTADNILTEKSDKKISLFKMKTMSANKEKKRKIAVQAKIHEICYVNLFIWKQSEVPERLRMWRSMALLSREAALRYVEKAFLEGTEVPSQAKLVETMELLWNSNSQKEKLQMWIGEDHFDHIERVAVWNTLGFNEDTFNLKKAELFEEWDKLNVENKLAKVKTIVAKHSRIISTIKSFKGKDKTQAVLNSCSEMEDFKLMLWLGLSYNEHWLKCLYMNQPIPCEAEIIAYLNLALNEKNIFALDGMDYGLEELLDGMIYDWVEAKAMLMTELHRESEIKNQIESSEHDIKALNDYKIFIINEVENHKKISKELNQEYSRYKN